MDIRGGGGGKESVEKLLRIANWRRGKKNYKESVNNTRYLVSFKPSNMILRTWYITSNTFNSNIATNRKTRRRQQSREERWWGWFPAPSHRGEPEKKAHPPPSPTPAFPPPRASSYFPVGDFLRKHVHHTFDTQFSTLHHYDPLLGVERYH